MPRSFEEINAAVESLRREVMNFMLTREEADVLLRALEGNAELEALSTRLRAYLNQIAAMEASQKAQQQNPPTGLSSFA